MIINPYAFGNPVCVYPLNASAAELISVGLIGKLAMSGGEQTGTLTLGPGVQADGMSVSGLELGASIPFDTGPMAIEAQFELPTITGTTPDVISRINFYESGAAIGSPVFSIRVYATSAGTFVQDVYIGATQVYTGAAATGSVRGQAQVDSGVLSVWFDGVAASLSSSAIANVAMFPISWIQKAIGVDGADTGKTASIQLITNANNMTGSYPFGTTDQCGNVRVIPQDVSFSSVTDGVSTDITESGKLWTVKTTAINATWHKAEVDSAKTTGKWYYEVEVIWTMLVDAREPAIGIAPEGTSTQSTQSGSNNAGSGGRIQYFASGEKREGGTYAAYGATFQDGDIIGIAFDGDARTITAYKNGVSQGVMYSGIAAGPFVPHFCRYHAVTGGGFRLKSSLLYLPSGYNVWT